MRIFDPNAPDQPPCPGFPSPEGLADPAFQAWEAEQDRETARRLAEQDAARAEVEKIEAFLEKMTGRTAG